MIHTQTGTTRRFLTFPAVNPCESISITTLVDSLLQISSEIISFKQSHFSTNKRSVKETLRHIENLVLVFSEIRILIRSGRSFPRSAILSLSELHVILQKLKFLIEDCTREGARLYTLINSGQVSAHFRTLTRSISTSLDTFPVRSIDLPREVNELIYLLIQQTRKSEARPDRADKQAIDSIYWIFGLFESRINPNSDEILRVLDHIGVRKWRDCIKEVDFIEETISVKTNSKAEIELLSNLMGFITYSRCVILQAIDDENDDEKEHKENDSIRGLNIDDLRCPISLEIMNDPVVLETGHSYDRSSITKWFASGNITCPKTGKTLTTTVLINNVSVKKLIQTYSKQNNIKKTTTTKTSIVPQSSAAKLTAEFLAGELINGDEFETVKALFEIRILTKTNSFFRACLIEAGVIETLTTILRSSNDPTIQENAMAGILNLSKDPFGKTRIINDLAIILTILNEGSRRESRQHAAATLFYLSSDYSNQIGELTDSITGLVRIVKSHGFSDSARRNSLITIRSLLIHGDNHWRVLASGVVPVLLDLMRSGEVSDDVIAILAKLAEYPDGMISVLRRGGLKLAVKVLRSLEVSIVTKEFCVVLILNLCVNGGSDVVSALAKDSVVMESLYTVLSNGGKKAGVVIKMIHEFQERKVGMVEPVFERENRFVHAW